MARSLFSSADEPAASSAAVPGPVKRKEENEKTPHAAKALECSLSSLRANYRSVPRRAAWAGIALVEKHLRHHDGDSQTSLAAVPPAPAVRQALQAVPGADWHASLRRPVAGRQCGRTAAAGRERG